MTTRAEEQPVFKPRARMILLLGDQLIRDAGLAVFELVKNAYDADASRCTVSMIDIESQSDGRIIVEDNGSGMSREIIEKIWLEPGTDFRFEQRKAKQRSPKYERLPLGEKGVGRFAAHKLGRCIKVISKAAHASEVVVEIDWHDFESGRYLSEIPISIKTRKPEHFTDRSTGTRIEVTGLREAWTRGKVRDLYCAVSSICSPFDEPAKFKAKLVLKPASDWLDGLMDIASVLEGALFKAQIDIQGNKVKYKYQFTPLPGMKSKLTGRSVPEQESRLMDITEKRRGTQLSLDAYKIGEISVDLYIFDRDPKVLQLATSDKAGLKKFLDQNGGIRIYRDGVRVFDFGEPGNDWLDLGGRRVNIPTVRVSNNQVIGAVSLRAGPSDDLVEKTNREGFIENDAYEAFRKAILFAITQVEAERSKDKDRLRLAYSPGAQREPVTDDVAELREELEKRQLTAALGQYVDRIESQFIDVRDRLMTAAGAGLTLTTVIHEVEKIIKELVRATKEGAPRDRLTNLLNHLEQMVNGLAFLARGSARTKEKASTLIHQALFNTEYRLKAHNINVTFGLDQGDKDFEVKCSRRLLVSSLMNLIDNSIYWVENKAPERKQLYIGTAWPQRTSVNCGGG